MKISYEHPPYYRDLLHWIGLFTLSLLLSIVAAQAATTCPEGYTSQSFSESDYSQFGTVNGGASLAKSIFGGTNSLTVGLTSNGISQSIQGSPNTGTGFQINQQVAENNGGTSSQSNIITFTFDKPISNFKLNIFDIDRVQVGLGRGYRFGDRVEITAFSQDGSKVDPFNAQYGGSYGTVATVNKTTIISTGTGGLFDTSTDDCSGSAVSTNNDCKGSLTFSELTPVKSITIKFADIRSFGNQQNIIARFQGLTDDNICVKQQDPKLTVKKVLNGNRADITDEFKIDIKEGSTNVGGFVTESVNGEFKPGKDRSATLLLAPNKSYTISEAIVGSNQVVKPNAINNYETTYTCTNASTASKTIIPTNGNGSSFTLSNLNYGDDITCSITNTARSYKFSGIVFNDNGGITAVTGAEQNADAPYSTTSEYFDGIFQPSKETGIYETGLKINLTDCQGNTLDNKIVAVTDNGPNIGQYSITLAKSKMVNAQGQPLNQVCLVELEPDGNLDGYPVDTTKNKLTIPLVANKFEYSNNNFGEVSQANSALVLQKRQYIAQCNSLPDNLSEIPQADDELPTIAFSTKDPQARVPPGHCIVYKITAINRGHVPLTAITIRDALQKQLPNGTGVTAYYQTSPATISPNGLSSADGAITESGQNGTIVTNPFALAAGQSKSLLFNTKFGLIND